MTQTGLSKPICIDYGTAAKPFGGESLSGDACLVRSIDGGVFLAVIDGIGHGRPAANAASAAVRVLEDNLDEPLVQLVQRCHRALIHERGVAMTLLSIQAAENSISWLGVGNVWAGIFSVESTAKQHPKSLSSQGGIVGYQLPKLQPSKAMITPGDWLVLATDGVRTDFNGEVAMNRPPQEVATRILSSHSKGNDDALVLAARYRGKGYE